MVFLENIARKFDFRLFVFPPLSIVCGILLVLIFLTLLTLVLFPIGLLINLLGRLHNDKHSDSGVRGWQPWLPPL